MACLWRSSGVWRLFHGQNVCFTHPHYTGQSVCEERGRRGCQVIHQAGHTRPTLWGLKKQQHECMCVYLHVLTWVYGKTCVSLHEHVLERASEHVCVCLFSFSACCMVSVLFCVCGCVPRQISKNARWEVSLYFQAVDGKQPLGSTGL